jgi:hypothetical protein
MILLLTPNTDTVMQSHVIPKNSYKLVCPPTVAYTPALMAFSRVLSRRVPESLHDGFPTKYS